MPFVELGEREDPTGSATGTVAKLELPGWKGRAAGLMTLALSEKSAVLAEKKERSTYLSRPLWLAKSWVLEKPAIFAELETRHAVRPVIVAWSCQTQTVEWRLHATSCSVDLGC